MKLIKHYHCILASAAMALNRTPDQLIEMIGHDGMEVLYPSLPKPGCYRGFHTQEIIEVALHLGKTATPVEARPVGTPDGEHTFELSRIGRFDSAIERFRFYLRTQQGIILGQTGRLHHACGFSIGKVYDPRGLISSLYTCKIQVLSLLIIPE